MIVHRLSVTPILLVGLILTTMMGSAAVTSAQSATSQGFIAKDSISEGALVSLSPSDYKTIEMASPSNRDNLLGVAIKQEQALVAFGDGKNQVQVVQTGQAPVQVSTANGDIKMNDYLSVSPISGVAMKGQTAGKVIGVAQQDFSSASKDTKQVTISDNQGVKKTVAVGLIVAQVTVRDWAPNGQPNSPILNGLRSFLGSAVGKPVSNTQALFSIGIIVLAILAAGTILYSSISSSIHSIGRNPLSKGIIRRSLFVMVGLAAVVLIGAGSAVILILGG